MQIGRKLYYDLATGNPIKLRESRSGSCIDTTKEQDFEAYSELQGRVPSSVGEIQFDYGQYDSEFTQYPFHVDITQTPHVIAWDAAIGRTLEQTQSDKKAQLWNMYNQTLTAGFVSSASGTSTTYGFSTTNQDEMTQVQAAISAGIETFPIDYGDNLGNIVPLTQAQFTVLESDANRFKWVQVKQLRALIGQAMTATTPDAVNAIQWTPATY